MSDIILKHKVKEESKSSTTSNILSWIRYIALLLIIFFIFRYVVGITIVSGHSMNPTLKNNDLILTSNIFFNVDRGDIVIVQDPHGFDIIKRVIALPNETIEIKSGIVYLNDVPLQEDYILGASFDLEKTTVPEGSYFIMGDNRTPGESLDSRDESIGPVPSAAVKGQRLLSLFPIKL
jgi:signal peptidase I